MNVSGARDALRALRVSVVILTYNRREKLRRCISSVLRSDFANLEVIVIDDGSSDGTAEMVAGEFPTCRLIKHARPTLTAIGINEGLRVAAGEYIVVVDDDNVMDLRAISEFVRSFESDPAIGVVGPVCFYLSEPNRIMYAGARLARFTRRTLFVYGNRESPARWPNLLDVDMFPNCFALRRSEAFRVGLVDTDLLPFFNDDASLQLAIKRNGSRVVLNPLARVWHDYPVGPRDRRTGFSEMRLYYAIRSKIILEKYYDSEFGSLLFALAFPLYLLGYLRLIAEAESPWSKKPSMIPVVLRAVGHGLLGYRTRPYVPG